MSALPKITTEIHGKHLGPGAPDCANPSGMVNQRGGELLYFAAPPSTPEGVQRASAPRDTAPPPLARGADGLSLVDAEAHQRNNALHYVLMALDAEVVGRMRSGDLAGGQRIQHIVNETKRRLGGQP